MSEGQLPEAADVLDPTSARRIAAAIERIATGDLTPSGRAELESLSPEDRRLLLSVGDMSRQLRRVVSELRRAAGSIESIASEVLRGTKGLSLSVHEEGASVEDTSSSIAEINVSLRRVEESITALSNLSQATSASSIEMAASIDQVSANADSLAQYVEETASAIEEMTASIRNVAENTESLAASAAEAARATAAIDESTHRISRSAQDAAELADDVMMSSQKGSSVVRETAATMREIKVAIDRATESIGALGRRSDQVGEISDVIKEIADRTNLLALNAAILASQAGPQGRGFRILADEIKELSERTAASTKEITALIDAVRDDVLEATERVAAGDSLSEKGVDQAYNAAALLDEISNNTIRASHKIRAIAEATSVQATESANVSESAELVRQRAQQIERATAEQAKTSQHIGERAIHMSELTEQVRRAAEEQADAAKHIAHAMEELTTVIEQIRGAVGEQSVGTDHVLRAIEVIKEGVARNQASIATINSAADALGRESLLLRREVEAFKMPAARRGGHAVLAYRDSQVSLDVLQETTVTTTDIVDNIFDGLVESGYGSEVLPALAERWEISPDGLVYTFVLRRDATFHNGRRVEAEDVRFTFERVLREGDRTGAWVFMPLEGAEEFLRGDAEHVAGIEVVDTRTVRIRLRRPLAFFLSSLCIDYGFILPRHEVLAEGEKFFQRPVGSGPYRVVGVEVEERRIELERFGEYYREDRGFLDRITISFGEQADLIERRLLDGELAYVKDPPIETVQKVEADPAWNGCVLRSVQPYTGCLVLDYEYPPFDSAQVRRAVAHAIDKERYVREVHGHGGVQAAGPIPPGLLGHDPDYLGLEYDPDRARALLARAGFPHGFRTTFWRSQGGLLDTTYERIKEDLAAVGIEVELRTADSAELAKARERGVVPMLWRAWVADYPDPDNFTYVLFHSSNMGMFSLGYSNAEVDQLAERGRSLMDREEREALYRRLARIIVEDVPAVFVMHRRNVVIHRPDLEGVRLHLLPPIVRPEEVWFTD